MKTLRLLTLAALAMSQNAPRAEPTPIVAPAAPAAFMAPIPPDASNWGANIGRTMTLLATSTPQKRHRVRILFYGQSITEQDWSKQVADDLRRRFPHADLEIENRAIGGFSSQVLWKTAQFDLFPFYPDLMIFHVYGSHIDYETIIREARRRTTTEILIQTDHVTRDEDLTEETDPAKLTTNSWNAWWNHAFLPPLAQKYGAELADQRAEWKKYLRLNTLKASDLLIDGVHLNAHGNFVMARLVEPHLRYDAKFSNANWKNLVRDYVVGRDVKWHDGKLSLPFSGNRVDVIAAPNAAPQGGTSALQVLVDGKKPSQMPELYVFTRPTGTPHIGWPGVIRLASQSPLQIEEWTARITETNEDASKFKFEISGSRTGPDGSGSSEAKFVSNSGRIVIEPEDWWPHHDWEISKKPIAAGWETRWRVVPQFVDVYKPPAVPDKAREYATTLAQGLSNGPHTLELSGDARGAAVGIIRVYEPPLK